MEIAQFQWLPDTGWDRPLKTTLSERAQIVFLFANADIVSNQEWIGQVRLAFPQAHIFGCTTGGEIHGSRVTDNSAVMTAVYLEKSFVRTARSKVSDKEDSTAAGKRLLSQLDPKGLRHVFILSDGLLVNGSDFLDGINSVLVPGVTISGGFAADGNRFLNTWVWCDSAPEQSSAIAIGFYGEELRIGVSTTAGWGPFGPDRLITRSHKNVLYEVDGRPVLSLYKEYLGEYASQLPAIGLMFPLELRDPKGEHRLLRTLLGIDEKEQSITFAGNVPEGWLSRFMVGDIEDLISGTHEAAKLSLPTPDPRSAEFSLVVSCNARRAVLKQRVDEEIDGVREILGHETVLAGFYSYGEIAAGPGRNCVLFNETMSITSFTEV